MKHREPVIKVDIANRQQRLEINRRLLSKAVRNVLAEAGVRGARISLAVVDDPEIHRLNRQFLAHDYPTDVLSFLLESSLQQFEAQIVVSADTAALQAAAYGWTADNELLLYVIHGSLHLAGYDDHRPRQRAAMRAKEAEHLARLKRGPQVPLSGHRPEVGRKTVGVHQVPLSLRERAGVRGNGKKPTTRSQRPSPRTPLRAQRSGRGEGSRQSKPAEARP